MDWLNHNAFFLVVMVAWIVVTAIALRGGSSQRSAVTDTASRNQHKTAHGRVLDLKTVSTSVRLDTYHLSASPRCLTGAYFSDAGRVFLVGHFPTA